VGNIYEDGVMVGYSGDFCPDEREVSWEVVADMSGMNNADREQLYHKELTTVTRRLRRVAMPTNGIVSEWLLERVVAMTGITHTSINFLNYIDWSTNNITNVTQITDKVWEYLKQFKQLQHKICLKIGVHDIPICLLGFGPEVNNVIEYRGDL